MQFQNRPSSAAAAWSVAMLSILTSTAVGGTPPAHAGDAAPLARYERSELHMGTLFTIVVHAPTAEQAERGMAAAFARIAELNRRLSDYDLDSELMRLCDRAPTTGPVPVSRDLFDVLERAQSISVASDGAFDVTVGPLTKLWRRARRQGELPAADRLQVARQAVGYQFVRLDPERQAVELLRPEMRIDLGGIAKGYACDAALAALRAEGLPRASVNAGGDLSLGDPPPVAVGWKVGVAPLEVDAPPSRFFWLANVAIATSGDAWQYVDIDGVRYSHLLDPATGLGLTTRSSVTVIARGGATADALASAVSVLGPERGLALIERTPGAAAVIVTAAADRATTHVSRRVADLRASPAADE